MTVTADRQREILENARVIAIVGHSEKPRRASYRIARYLKMQGYRVIPVNPTVERIDGAPSYPSLADVPTPVDIVNVFRRSQYLLGHVEQAITVGAPVVWAQLGVHDDAAVRAAEAAGIEIVTNVCIQIAHQQLVLPRR